jgi:hypothetical protein
VLKSRALWQVLRECGAALPDLDGAR